jgi:hypothetical protein
MRSHGVITDPAHQATAHQMRLAWLSRRTLAIVLDGLRPVHTDCLPGTTPGRSQLARSTRSERPFLGSAVPLRPGGLLRATA